MAASGATIAPDRHLLAPLSHLIIVVLILCGAVYLSFRAQRLSPPSAGRGEQPAPAQGLPPNTMYRILIPTLATEWLLLLYVWGGVRRHGGRMSDLTGGRWKSTRDVLLDFAIALPFWIFWTATAKAVWWLLGPASSTGGPFRFPPHGWLDITFWIAVSVTAGFCEEVIYRGYLQKQIAILTRKPWPALIAQAVLFGAGHLYQGYKPVLVITVLGLEYGLLAHWRRNLRPGIISHAWSDVFEGYVKFLW